MQVTINTNLKQRSSSLNSTRSYRKGKGISITSKPRYQSTERKDQNNICLILNTNDSSNPISERVLPINYRTNSLTNTYEQKLNQMKLNPKITFKYTNNPGYYSINNSAHFHTNRFINFPFKEIQCQKNRTLSSQTSIKQLQKIKQYVIMQRKSINTNDLNKKTPVETHININKNLIDSRTVPRTIINQEVKIFVRQPIPQTRQPIKCQQQSLEFIGMIKPNKQQNLITLKQKNQQNNHLSPYHMLQSTKKMSCQSQKQLHNKQANNQIQVFSLVQISQNNKIYPFQIINEEDYRPQVKITKYQNQIQRQNLSGKSKQMSLQMNNTIKEQKQIKIQKIINNGINLIAQNSQQNRQNHTESAYKVKSQTITQKILLQNIQNINPSSKNKSRCNTKRIRQIERRLQEIINICDKNL